ncbi:MAG: hypothetical protein WAN60_07165 [Candidatus Sulfotelmatobacter sp.]
MKVKRSFFWAALLLLAAIGGVFLVLSPVAARGNSGLTMWGVPDDWSHHHLIFSDPGSFADAVKQGSFERWYKVAADPRFIFQQEKRVGWATGIGGGPPRGRIGPLRKDWTMTLGSGGMVGAGQYPAKYQFGIATASCANDFVVYNTGLAGSATQPTIIAYSNLYSSCSGSKPSVYWQYNTAYPQGSTTGDASVIPTSVVLSGTGTQLAFVQNNSSNVASLVLLKWQSSSSLVQMDTGINNVTPGNYLACAAPCMTRLTFSGSAKDTNSPPFYDYAADTMYVGDNSGKLHKFNPVFSGSPTEVTATWPITVSANVLTAPVYDFGTGHIFVADSGGFLYSYTTAGAAVMKSSQLAATGSKGIVDGPLVDSSTGFVYVFVGDDKNTSTTAYCTNATGCNGVFQFAAADSTIGTGVCTPSSATAWSGTNCGKESVFGVGAASIVIYDGSFDRIYYAGSGTTGNLWTCAENDNAGTPRPKLMQNAMSAFVTSGDVISTAANTTLNPITSAAGATCSPVTEVFGSGGTTDDYIFLSVTANGNLAACAGACLYNFVVSTNGTTTTVPTAATAGLAAAGGSSGIIMDNISTTGGASQIYFSSLSNETCAGSGTAGSGTGGCAVQASQAAP